MDGNDVMAIGDTLWRMTSQAGAGQMRIRNPQKNSVVDDSTKFATPHNNDCHFIIVACLDDCDRGTLTSKWFPRLRLFA
jgi:hypothetical protein